MKITLESTTEIIDLQTPTGTVPGRVWEGATVSGIKVQAIITRIAVHNADNHEQFERELTEQRPPVAELRAFPLRMIL